MPEFRLDYQKQPPLPPLKRDFITKNEYNSGVKVTDWDRERESFPLDYNATIPPCGNQHRSSYKRLGHGPDVPWITETAHMLAQVKTDKIDTGPLSIPLISYGNYRETKLEEKDIWRMSPADCFTDYQSVMHNDYKMPYPYNMQPLALPKPPFMTNRRIKNINPTTETNKFLDDCHIQRVKISQEFNKHKYKSYNPATFKYSDGSDLPQIVRKYYDLPYSHVD